MASDYETALRALYQGDRESFIAERKRLAAELKANGDRDGAARLGKLPRPSLAAWVVNQLWWRSRSDFERAFETAQALRAGKLSEASEHRKAIARLSSLAQASLREQGHESGDAIARRITMTLSALAANGGFEPDAPGTLSRDRDPPGFDAFGIDSATLPEPRPRARPQAEPAPDLPPPRRSEQEVPKPPVRAPQAVTRAEAKRAREATRDEARRAREAAKEEAKRAREAEALARARAAEERAKRLAQRRERERALAELETELAERDQERSRLLQELSEAERARAKTLERLSTARVNLAELSEED